MAPASSSHEIIEMMEKVEPAKHDQFVNRLENTLNTVLSELLSRPAVRTQLIKVLSLVAMRDPSD